MLAIRGTTLEDVQSGHLGNHAYKNTPQGWEAAIMRALCRKEEKRPALAILMLDRWRPDPELPNPHKVTYAKASLVRLIPLTRPEVYELGLLPEFYG